MAKVKLTLEEEQARDVIRALAVHARALAPPPSHTQAELAKNLPRLREVERLDVLRHDIESKVG